MKIDQGFIAKKKKPCQGTILKISILYTILTYNNTFACFGGTEYQAPKPKLNKTSTIPKIFKGPKGINKTLITKNFINAWNGFEIDAQTGETWYDWLKDWLHDSNNTDVIHDEEHSKRLKKEREGAIWPNQNAPGWQDLGDGIDGVPVPPWAYVPKDTGKPANCREPLTLIDCNPQKPLETKWGYNSYTDACETMKYSQCGENKNKFDTKLKCEQHCMVPPPPTCDSDSSIPVDNRNIYN